MIIKELVLHNFGVYASTNRFEFCGEKPVVLIGGMNGRGKTTFLEAVLLSLYGSNSFAYNESKYKSYGQYLKSFVNVSDGTMESYVDLVFLLDSELYKVHREWTGARQRVSEIIKVYKDGEYNQFLTDNWTMFIENILPSGLSNFFFFDGEKIAELAVEDTSSQMKESIKTLLGISVLDLLRGDLNRIINRTAKKKIAIAEAQEIEQLREVKENAVERLERVDCEIASLEEKRTEVFQKLEEKKQEYSAKGGDIVVQRQELFQKRTDITSHIDSLKEQLLSDAASELPFLLVKKILKGIRNNAEIEQDQKMLSVALKKMRLLLPEYNKVNISDKKAVERFISYVDGKMGDTTSYVPCNLSDMSLFKLQVLLDDQLLAMKNTVISHQKELEKLQKQADQIDSYMAVDIDEKEIAKIYRKIKELEQEIVDIDVKLGRKIEEGSIFYRTFKKVKKVFQGIFK